MGETALACACARVLCSRGELGGCWLSGGGGGGLGIGGGDGGVVGGGGIGGCVVMGSGIGCACGIVVSGIKGGGVGCVACTWALHNANNCTHLSYVGPWGCCTNQMQLWVVCLILRHTIND